MADKKISQLTALSAANLAPSTDVLAIVDTSATETKKIVAQDLINGVLNVASAVGIGTASPGKKLDVSGTVRATVDTGSAAAIDLTYSSSTRTIHALETGGSNARPLRILAQSLTYADDSATRLTVDTSGNLGLGVTPSAWRSAERALQIGGATALSNITNFTILRNNNYVDSGNTERYLTTAAAGALVMVDGQYRWLTAPSGTAGNAISFTQAMTLDASGNLGVGTTSPNRLSFNSDARVETIYGPDRGFLELGSETPVNSDVLGGVEFVSSTTSKGYVRCILDGSANGILTFATNNTERARITAGGIFGVGITNPTGSLSDTAGVQLGPEGYVIASRAGAASLYVNRKTDDGDLVLFYQADTQEGSISVSGNTVSYNAFAGSHWSQLQDGSKPNILRGTVMESINELCVWPGEQNERLPKSKISDTAGSKKVYGVFMAWDNDWTQTNDMYVTAVGAFICRINGSVTVQEGDLLESNGDGTARVQADDIIRSSTIGKVTSTVKTHEYDDGSYCVPTVLYCG